MVLLIAFLRFVWRTWLCICCADLVSGAVHWWEDTYGKRSWPILGRLVIEPNLEHHARPRSFLKHGVWKSIDIQVVLGGALILVAWSIGWLSYEFSLIVVLMIAANVTHRWAHSSESENGGFITLLQKLHVVQTRAYHSKHHTRNADRHYCALTPWLDPILDAINFWRRLEYLVTMTTGIRPVELVTR